MHRRSDLLADCAAIVAMATEALKALADHSPDMLVHLYPVENMNNLILK